MSGEVIVKRAVKFVLANLILFSAGVVIGAEPIQACRNGTTRGCSIKGMPGQQMCDGGVWTACSTSMPSSPTLPNPVLAFAGTEKYQVNGQNLVRYKLSVTNHAAYPNAMFEAAPNLPPCGANKNASRTWVNIYQVAGNSYNFIYGFCAFNSSDQLTGLWFAVPTGQPVPSPVLVVLDDRLIVKNYRSNSVAIPPAP